MMLALKLRDPKVMQAALERSIKERERFFKKELYSGKEYYQAVIPGPPEGRRPGRRAASRVPASACWKTTCCWPTSRASTAG